MHDLLLKAYHRLPAPARSALASIRGMHLRRERYGPDAEDLVRQALDRDRWPPERWDAWRRARLARILERAAGRVPYYRGQWAGRQGGGDAASWDELDHWPILEKSVLRSRPRELVADDRDVRRMVHEHTSGTSGTPVNIWYDRECVRAFYAIYEARCRRWYGVSRRDRWANLGGQLVAPVAQPRPPFWVWNASMNQLYMSSYHLSERWGTSYVDALVSYRIRFLLGYTSSLYALALEVLRTGRRIKMEVAVTNAEPVFDYQRRAISEAFECPVRETYGMSELAGGASECEHGRLHLWPDVGIVEVVDGAGRAAAEGEAGDLVLTGLMNEDMPLIRYRVGDRGVLSADKDPCPCGRLLPILARVEGRIDDVLFTADGRRVGRLDPVFKADLRVREAQVVQEALDRIRVRYVPDEGFGDPEAHSLIKRLRDRLGSVEVVLEPLDRIPRGVNGKFRAVVCMIPPHERPASP